METHLLHGKVGTKAPAVRPHEVSARSFQAPIVSLEKRTRYETVVIL